MSDLEIKKDKVGYIYSHIRKKYLVETPEERVRQEFLVTLVNNYWYSLDQIKEEALVTWRGSGKARADFLIWKSKEDRENKKTAFIVVECKSDNVKINAETYAQWANYAQYERAKFFVTHNNHETKFWKVDLEKRMPNFDEIEDIPKANATNKEIEELLSKLKVFKEEEFAKLLHECHNIIRNREKLDPAAAFDEIAKILFMKVYAERNLKAEMKQNIFTLNWVEQAEKYNPDYLYDMFEKTKTEFWRDKLFKKDEKINLRVATIKAIIEKLQAYNLSSTSTDVKGIAFEKFLGRTFRGEIWQFFTPRSIVEFMVKMLNPQENDVVCDPAAGSGWFLINFFEIVREKIHASIDGEYHKKALQIEKLEISSEEKAKFLMEADKKRQEELNQTKEGSRTRKLANRCVYWIDANDRMARTSKMNMIMHGDWHGWIHHHDGFLNVNGIFEWRFDMVLANPPFWASVEKDDIVLKSQVEVDEDTLKYYRETYWKQYEESQAKLEDNIGKPIMDLFQLPKSKSIKTEILFIERCLDLLKDSGRMGIVLPEGIFNNPNSLYVRQFVEDRAYLKAVISLPQETFISAWAAVKCSLLFLEKFNEEERKNWKTLIEKYEGKILESQKEERGKLERLLKDKTADKEKKAEAKKTLKELDNYLATESRNSARKDFDYPIFMVEAESVWISTTGETGENIPNELPAILEQFLEFEKNPEDFISKYKN